MGIPKDRINDDVSRRYKAVKVRTYKIDTSTSIHSDDGNPTSANIKQALSSHNVLQLKNFEKDGYTSFQDEERYDHVGLKVISLQEGKRSQDDEEIMFG
ncbi:hypothetical protein Tco_0641502 [Tanacetum coccineum]